MKAHIKITLVFCSMLLLLSQCTNVSRKTRITENFCDNWKFHLGDTNNAHVSDFDDSEWRLLNLPHDWSIEGEFSKDNPATPGGGALPGGIGWYRKSFNISESEKDKLVFIDFDGVYLNSEVWVNNNYLGKRPYGYISFRYEITSYLNYGEKKNIIAVKVDNSQQPNSRWYSGSGIYRNVWLVYTDKVNIDHWGTNILTPKITDKAAEVNCRTLVKNGSGANQLVVLSTIIYNSDNKKVAQTELEKNVFQDSVAEFKQDLIVNNPCLWSIEKPYLYKAVSEIRCNGKIRDNYETKFGIRYFTFDSEKGFFLNGKSTRILGVCNHHDLGCLGAAINTRALERQLEILKEMGCNGIRTSHNPPAPELLDLCDKMGFIVMDEAFDMWKKKKTEFDYSNNFNQWHKRDLEDMVLRDRNHPSVFIWSIGNEILEQWDSTGVELTKEMVAIIKDLDKTRPITLNCNDPNPSNYIIKSGALDLIGYSYHQQMFADFPKTYPGQKFIGSETTSALATRGYYQMPSDTIHRWPIAWDIPFTKGNPDFTCSSYDNCSAPWGSTHEETWKVIKKYEFLSGMYVWTGFDYIGEPTPYGWPARSSYFGIVDLAGFPKDAYYMYQSEWTHKPVLHIFPHWNWNDGDTIDIWAYTNYTEVELFLNGKSIGTRKKVNDDIHLMWRAPYSPGIIKAIARKNESEILTKEIKTAGKPAKIILEPDRKEIKADGRDLSFVTVKIVDKEGTVVPYADNLVNFTVEGEAFIAGVDNGNQISHEPFKANYRKAFNGMCLVVLQSKGAASEIKLTAESEALEAASMIIEAKN